jgi:LPXTG-motif cell wall-anchored protein
MKIAINTVSIFFLLLPGLVFFLQGVNILPGSVMTGDPKWAVIGGIMLVLGAGLFWFANRKK